jgi:hypothetical protein
VRSIEILESKAERVSRESDDWQAQPDGQYSDAARAAARAAPSGSSDADSSSSVSSGTSSSSSQAPQRRTPTDYAAKPKTEKLSPQDVSGKGDPALPSFFDEY